MMDAAVEKQLHTGLPKPGPRFTKICKSYKFIRPMVYHRRNEFLEQKSFVRTFVKRAAGL